MNKKDIAQIRKELKVDNIMLNIKEIYKVYTKKETGEILHSESQPFSLLEQEQQELFMGNFKKVLSGQLDSKLFELKFEHGVDNSTKSLLYRGLTADVETWKEKMDEIVAKFVSEFSMEKDAVFTFIRAEYRKPVRKKKEEEDEGADDEVYVHRFILGSLNKIDMPKRAVMFDYSEKEFKSNSVTDVVINLTSPLEGFMFPAVNNNQADVNHVLYSAGKKDCPDPTFIEKVLNCTYTTTAKEEKQKFEDVLKEVIGEKVDSSVIASIYDEINKVIEENEDSEEPTLDSEDIKHILNVSGVEGVETVEDVFQAILDDKHYEFKASSLIPNYTSKSVKINTKVANVAISPRDLRGIAQVINHKGKRCLLIEVDEDVEVEGFVLESGRM